MTRMGNMPFDVSHTVVGVRIVRSYSFCCKSKEPIDNWALHHCCTHAQARAVRHVERDRNAISIEASHTAPVFSCLI
jgi:hypothetical protein